ncbi:hypothetical protein [Photobacterium leiognathi]|uniref:hypothetical protein n=1 Tax=Photobacterium leiognathi TaxID=553611 RepID=UPI0027388788|nr:hypothetical protein [Photobacterium leiognathi]
MENMDINKLVNMNIENIMKVGEVKLVKPESSKRIDDKTFEFTFITSTFTDPEWRSIFEKAYIKKIINFHGSTAVLVCQPTELQEEVDMIKAAMAETNLSYSEKREALVKQITEAQKKEKEALRNKQLEDEQVKEMFESLVI